MSERTDGLGQTHPNIARALGQAEMAAHVNALDVIEIEHQLRAIRTEMAEKDLFVRAEMVKIYDAVQRNSNRGLWLTIVVSGLVAFAAIRTWIFMGWLD